MESNLLLKSRKRSHSNVFISSRQIHYCEKISRPWDLGRREYRGNCNLDNLRLVSLSHGNSLIFLNEGNVQHVHFSVISKKEKMLTFPLILHCVHLFPTRLCLDRWSGKNCGNMTTGKKHASENHVLREMCLKLYC